MNMNAIIQAQDSVWFFLLSPLGALIFLVAAIAELGLRAVRPVRGASRTGGRVQHRILGDEIRHVLRRANYCSAMTFGASGGSCFFGGYRFFGWSRSGPFLAIRSF